MKSLGALFAAEILEQPEVIRRVLAQPSPQLEAAVHRLRTRMPAFVLLVARGSSDNAARYAQYVFGARNGMAAGLALPSLVTVYGRAPRLDQALVLAISQSGRSPDVVQVVTEGRRQGALTVAIVNDRTSPLAGAAELAIDMGAGPERAVAASKSYTASLFTIAHISSQLNGDEADLRALSTVSDGLARALSVDIRPILEVFDGPVRHVAVLGRGYHYATAHEVALKLRETTGILAEPWSPADLRHGPLVACGPDTVALVIEPVGPPAALTELRAASRALAERGARVVRLSLGDGTLAPHLEPIALVALGQRLACELAVRSGRDPDEPAGLTKVTETR